MDCRYASRISGVCPSAPFLLCFAVHGLLQFELSWPCKRESMPALSSGVGIDACKKAVEPTSLPWSDVVIYQVPLLCVLSRARRAVVGGILFCTQRSSRQQHPSDGGSSPSTTLTHHTVDNEEHQQGKRFCVEIVRARKMPLPP